MAIYAVRVGNKRGKFNTWNECSRYVIGFPGAEYKKCDTEEEADRYLGIVKDGNITGLTKVIPVEAASIARKKNDCVSSSQLSKGEAVAYIDGSYSAVVGAYSFGCIFISENGKRTLSGMDTNKKLLEYRNISGELIAAMIAVEQAKKEGVSKLTIVHDFAGTANWVHGTWVAKSELARAYRSYMRDNLKSLPIFFQWVKGHSGHKAGDKADYLAKNAIKNRIHYDTTAILKDYMDFSEIEKCELSSHEFINSELVLV